jgi:hypothetical protein
MEEFSNGKGKLAEASEEGQGPRRAVMMTMNVFGPLCAVCSKYKQSIIFPGLSLQEEVVPVR